MSSAFSVIQHASTTAASSLSFGSNVTAGSMIVVVIGIFNGSDYTGVTVNGNAANLIASYVDANDSDFIQIWALTNAYAGATTVNISGGSAAGGGPSLAIIEVAAPVAFYISGFVGGTRQSTPMQTISNNLNLPCTEIFSIFAAYDQHASHTWTVSNLTLLEETSETGGQTMAVTSFDVNGGTDSTVRTLIGGQTNLYGVQLIAFVAAGGLGAGGLGATYGLQALDDVLGSGTPATWYAALMSTAPTDAGGGVEVSGSSYARITITNNGTNFPNAALVSGIPTISNGTLLSWGPATGTWPAAVAVALYDASTGGNLGPWAFLTAPLVIVSSQSLQIPIGDLVFTQV